MSGSFRSEKPIQSFLNAFKIFSLDVTLGAVASCYFAGEVFNKKIPVSWYLVLALGTLSIYLFDHMLDQVKLLPAHNHHSSRTVVPRKISVVMIIILSLMAVIIAIVHLSLVFIVLGLIIMAWTTLYYVTNKTIPPEKRKFFPKELLISIGYLGGVFGPALIQVDSVSVSEILITATFWMLVLINTLIFSLYDADTDQQMNWHGVLRIINVDQLRQLIYLLLTGSIILITGLIYIGQKAILFSNILAAMTLLLIWTAIDQEYWLKNRRFSYLADAVFLLPGLAFFF